MSKQIEDIISAVSSGDMLAFEDAVNSVMKEKIVTTLDAMKEQVGASMFESAEPIEGVAQIIEAYNSLDEISKTTLGSYIKKASRDSSTKSHQKDQLRKDAVDIRSKSSSFTGYNVGLGNRKERNDFNDHGEKLANTLDKHADGLNNKIYKRARGIHTAIGKLTKEEFDMVSTYILENLPEAYEELGDLSDKLGGVKKSLSFKKKTKVDESILEDLLALTEITEESISGCIKKIAKNYRLEKMGIPFGELKNKASAEKMSIEKLKTVTQTAAQLKKEDKEYIVDILNDLEMQLDEGSELNHPDVKKFVKKAASGWGSHVKKVHNEDGSVTLHVDSNNYDISNPRIVSAIHQDGGLIHNHTPEEYRDHKQSADKVNLHTTYGKGLKGYNTYKIHVSPKKDGDK